MVLQDLAHLAHGRRATYACRLAAGAGAAAASAAAGAMAVSIAVAETIPE